jgi:hypothetical protein
MIRVYTVAVSFLTRDGISRNNAMTGLMTGQSEGEVEGMLRRHPAYQNLPGLVVTVTPLLESCVWMQDADNSCRQVKVKDLIMEELKVTA